MTAPRARAPNAPARIVAPIAFALVVLVGATCGTAAAGAATGDAAVASDDAAVATDDAAVAPADASVTSDGASVAPQTGHAAVAPADVGVARQAGDAVAGSTDTVGVRQAGGLAAAQSVDADEVTLRVDLRPDGDAAWTVTYRQRLADDNETDAFRTLRADVRENPENYTGRFAARMRATAAAAENATGREMAVGNVTVTAELQTITASQYGIVRYRFEWTNFAAVDGDRLVAGDALGGLFLDERTTLVVAWPADYALEEASPPPTSGGEGEATRVTWQGPEEFGPEGPRVVVAPESEFPSAGLAAAAALLVLLVAGGGVAWYRRRGGPAPLVTEGRSGAGGEATTAPGGGGAASSEGTGDGGRTPPEGDGDDPTQGLPEELLSNEERVMKLVRERGGRVKQQEIVQAFDWTEAKTSQVVRDLREEGKLEGFRLGRENVLRLPEEDGALDEQ